MAAIGGVQSSTATTAVTAPKQDIFGGMGPDAFLKLLVAQLRYQNPMNPSDPTAMMGQIAQYAQVEALTKLQQGQSIDQSLSEARLATELVGKFISASDGMTSEAGKVVSARFTATGPVLVLDNGAEVTLSAVTKVDQTDPLTSTPSTAPATTPATTAPSSTPPSSTPAAASTPAPAPVTPASSALAVAATVSPAPTAPEVTPAPPVLEPVPVPARSKQSIPTTDTTL
jgi:flagellar basal-body rod modification protein FlgD